jgi:hypothetical protein
VLNHRERFSRKFFGAACDIERRRPRSLSLAAPTAAEHAPVYSK